MVYLIDEGNIMKIIADIKSNTCITEQGYTYYYDVIFKGNNKEMLILTLTLTQVASLQCASTLSLCRTAWMGACRSVTKVGSMCAWHVNMWRGWVMQLKGCVNWNWNWKWKWNWNWNWNWKWRRDLGKSIILLY